MDQLSLSTQLLRSLGVLASLQVGGTWGLLLPWLASALFFLFLGWVYGVWKAREAGHVFQFRGVLYVCLMGEYIRHVGASHIIILG